jgi:hypothetical protein
LIGIDPSLKLARIVHSQFIGSSQFTDTMSVRHTSPKSGTVRQHPHQFLLSTWPKFTILEPAVDTQFTFFLYSSWHKID